MVLIIGLLIVVAIFVVIFVSSKKAVESTKVSMEKFKGNPKVLAIGEYIVSQSGGRPKEILFLTDNQIFFGPVQGAYLNVPEDMIGPMTLEDRRGVASVLADAYGYSWSIGYNGMSLEKPQTGIPSIDEHCACYLHADATGSWD